MPHNLLDFFKSTYQCDSDCVLIFDQNFALIWHNSQPAPFELSGDLPALFHFQKGTFPKSGDYTFYIREALHEYHLINIDNEYFIVSCSTKSILHKLIHDQHRRENLENQLANQHQKTFGIRNAVQQIYNLVEESECEELTQRKLFEYLNIISNNCSHLLKTPYTLRELMSYFDQFQLNPEPLNCAFELSQFVRHCSALMGQRSRVQILPLQAESELPILAHRGHLEFCLMCILLILCKNEAKCQQVRIQAQQIGNNASIVFTADIVGEEQPQEHILSEFVPLYKLPEFEEENLVIQKFCQVHQAVFLQSIQNGCKTLCLRIPLSDIPVPPTVNEPISHLHDHAEILYRAMLSGLTEFRDY